MWFPVTNCIVRNVALNKPTSQSSTLRWGDNVPAFDWESRYAVDGKKDHRTISDIGKQALCSGTGQIPFPPWWQVDLGATYTIQSIEVFGRTNDPPVQLRGFMLYISSHPGDRRSSTLAYTDSTNDIDYTAHNGNITISHFDKSRTGRYVIIEMTNKYKMDDVNAILILCEVEVYAGIFSGKI